MARQVREHFKDPDNRVAFEAWYEKKTGRKYEWKNI